MRKIILGLLAAVFCMSASDVAARFVSVDPVPANPNTGQNFNRYVYANSNPYRFVDPDGRQSRDLEITYKYAIKYGQHAPCCTSLTEEQAGIIVDFMPGFGDAKGIADAYNTPSLGNIVGATIGLVPIIGDFGKHLIRNADDLIKSAGSFQRLKGGVLQGNVQGDAQAVFKAITEGGEALPNGMVKMEDGTLIGTHTSTKTGVSTIDINTGDQVYKIRVRTEEAPKP